MYIHTSLFVSFETIPIIQHAPVNFNTASFEELKTVLSKNKSHAVLKACEKAAGHLTIKAFHSATKMSQNAFQKMVNQGAIVYEVESSMQTPSQVTLPPSSEENSPAPTGEDQSILGATANLGESGFQLMPAKFPFTPSGPPYIDNRDEGLMPANGVLEQNNTDPVVMRKGVRDSTLYLAFACCLLLKVLLETVQVVW